MTSPTRRRPEAELAHWLQSQARREATAVRLEDALLGDRFASYFIFRLRFFSVRTAFTAVLHAVKIVLLFKAFPRDQFVAIIVLGAGAAIANDFWWGALERMRQSIRALRRDGAVHRVPSRIGSWLRFAARLSRVGLGLAGCWVGYRLFLGGGLGPVDAYAAVLGAGLAVGLAVRTYHSGAYALRRIYRPLPSMLAADSLGIVSLLGLWPVLGIWAFPIAETLAMAAVLAITAHYTTRTYRMLGFPTLWSLLTTPRPLPTLAVLRAALAPGTAYALVGIESLVLFAVLASSGGTGKAFLLALLAALGPIIRAGFDWAQLLYFDLVRLEVPLLRGLQRRFDTAIMRLAAIMGIATWAMAATLGASLLGIRDVALLVTLLPFFVTRSLLASAQVRAFTAGAYRRLSVLGVLGGLASLAALAVVATEADRLAVLSVVLGVSFLALLTLPTLTDPEDRVLALPDWLARLRSTPGPVTVTRVAFDTRTEARGVTAEERQTEEWRRRQVARYIGSEVHRRGGAAAWLDPFQLAWFGSEDDLGWIARMGGGLVMRRPAVAHFATGAAAAKEVLGSSLGLRHGAAAPDLHELIAEFRRSFPAGITYQADRPAPVQLAAMSSRERSEILRAALRFARDPVQGSEPQRWDVTALADAGHLRAIFVIDRRSRRVARRQWAERVRAWDLATAALGRPDRVPARELPGFVGPT